MTKKVLLVGSSFSAAPVFFELKRRGCHVSVCGSYAADPCHQYADTSYLIDYSRPDELLKLVDSGRFDHLVPTCNDYSYMSCTRIAEQRDFSGFDRLDTAVVLHTKHAFREVMEKLGLPSPRWRRHAEGRPIEVGGLRFPLLVKPTDAFSGRGMTKVTQAVELPAAVEAARQASRTREALVEEFVDGRLYSHSAFLRRQAIAADFFVDEFCTVYPYQVNCSNHPSSLPETTRAAVRAAIGRLAEALGLCDGLLHTQFIADGERFWIIECMRRCPGDLYGSLVAMSTGVRYTDLFVRPFLGEDLPERLAPALAKPCGRHTVSTRQPLVAFSFSGDIPGAKVRVVPLKNSGEKLGAAPFDKLAILFAEYTDEATMFTQTPHLAELVGIQAHDATGDEN